MKVAKTKRIFKKIGELLEIRAIERNIGLLLDRPIALDTIVFDDIDSLLGFAEFFKKNMSQFGFRYTDDESIMAGMVMSVIGGLDKVDEDIKLHAGPHAVGLAADRRRYAANRRQGRRSPPRAEPRQRPCAAQSSSGRGYTAHRGRFRHRS